MQRLVSALVTELERPRPLTPQVLKHLTGTHGVTRDDLNSFLTEQLPALEDFEVDLILAPLFTPTLRDQAVFAALLGADAVPASEWPGVIQQLVARPTCAQLVIDEGQVCSVPLREVVVERYVHRLRLQASLPTPLFQLIANLVPAADRPFALAVARRGIWESEPRRRILMRFLTTTATQETFRIEDTIELLRWVENYEPADATDLLRRLPQWQQSVRHDRSLASNPKPFFNERVQELHGGGRDQRRQDDARLAAQERELTFLDRLKSILGTGE